MIHAGPARVTAVLVGVARPAAFKFRGRRYTFATARGVTADIDWYEELLRNRVPAEQLSLTRLTTPGDTTADNLSVELTTAAGGVQPSGLFVLVLCGHGFQAADDNGDEPDNLDEVFAASNGPIADDFFAHLWSPLPPNAGVVVFADTCSADSVGIAGGLNIEPVIALTAAGPSRVSISASMPWEKASEVATRHGYRGVMSLALEDAWTLQEAQASYLTWFRTAAELVSVRRPQQHPRLRYLGPDQHLLNRVPFAT